MKTKLHKKLAVIISFIALPTLLADNLKAMRDDETLERDFVNRKFLIKNTAHKEFLYVSDYIPSDDPLILGSEAISRKSVFTLERTGEGYKIKNTHSGSYLYAASSDTIGWDRVVEAGKKHQANYFFDILKEGGKYILKNAKYQEYMLLSDVNRRNGDRVCKTWSKLADNSYFTFVEYNWDYFH